MAQSKYPGIPTFLKYKSLFMNLPVIFTNLDYTSTLIRYTRDYLFHEEDNILFLIDKRDHGPYPHFSVLDVKGIRPTDITQGEDPGGFIGSALVGQLHVKNDQDQNEMIYLAPLLATSDYELGFLYEGEELTVKEMISKLYRLLQASLHDHPNQFPLLELGHRCFMDGNITHYRYILDIKLL